MNGWQINVLVNGNWSNVFHGEEFCVFDWKAEAWEALDHFMEKYPESEFKLQQVEVKDV